MKRLLLVLMLVFSNYIASNAQTFHFKDGDTYDFKSVKQGPEITHNFIFENVGNEPLLIQNVAAACGCAIASWPKDPVPPGAKGIIAVKMMTNSKKGYFNTTFNISSNATNNNDYRTLYIKGTIATLQKQ